jgi:hypothetical protein
MIGGVISGVIRPPVRGLTRNTGGGAPTGFILLVDEDGAFLVDEDGAYLMEAI